VHVAGAGAGLGHHRAVPADQVPVPGLAGHSGQTRRRLVFHILAALAEFIRKLIIEGTREGLDAARARGARLGRPRP
jgi:hypothetical protein